MKTLATLCGLLWVSALLFAQAPESFKYQAVLRDAAGNIKANTPASIQLSILQGSVSGTSVYSETHGVTTNEFGLVNLTVGNGSSKVGTMAAIDWSSSAYFLKVTIDGTDFGTSQLLSVPYALYAKNAANGFSGSFVDLTSKPTTIGGYGITDAYTKTNLLTAGEAQIHTGNLTDGILIVARGGTGAGTLSGILVGNGTEALSSISHTAGNQYLRRTADNMAYEFGTLASVAGSGNYNDLSNRPTILNSTYSSTATGFEALINSSGYQNTAYGNRSLYSNTSGAGNTGNGYRSLYSNTTGSNNTANGFNSLYSNTTGHFNTANGLASLYSNTTGNYNTSNGGSSLSYNTTGIYNTASGYKSLYYNTTGNYNTAIGTESLYSNAANSRNTAVGFNSMYNAQNSSTGRETFNTAVGFEALRGGTIVAGNTGQYNTAIGDQALYSNTSGYNNVANGVQALFSNTSGDYNTASGVASLYSNTTGVYNTANGFNSLYSNTTGNSNTAHGSLSLYSNTTGTYNTANGIGSLYSNTTGSSNTASGMRALSSNTSGNSNSAYGFYACYNNTTGINNTALGYHAGYNNTTGSNNIFIGNNAQGSATDVSNQITLGNSSITSLRCAVQSISSLSDRRDKRDIQDLSVGLDFLMQLKPREFNWDRREWYEGNYSDGSLMQSKPTAGFIAQELDEVQTQAKSEWLNLVLKDNPDKLEATYGNLLPVMVKAIQEQQKLIEELKKENAQLRSDINCRIQKLETMLNSEVKVKQE